jgi:DNA polymerase-1
MIVSNNHIEHILSKIQKANQIAVDTETVSIEDKTLVAFSFTLDNYSYHYYVVPVNMKHIENVSKSNVKKLLKALCYRDGTIYHNYSFDGQVLFKWIPKINNYSPNDTMVMSHLINEHGSHGLKQLVRNYFSYKMLSFKEVCGTGKKQISFSELMRVNVIDRYAGEDAFYTLKLYHVFRQKIKDECVESCYEDIERPLLRVVLDMHLNGVPINKHEVEGVKKVVEKGVEKYQRLLDKTMKGVNINSPKQLREFFISKKGMKVMKLTPKGSPSVDSEVLEHYAEVSKEAEYILEYRKYNKILSTFIPAMTPNKEGRIYPTFRQVGTTSGRFSSSDPNFQNIPKSKDDRLDLRACVKAPKGKVFIGFDYKQMELCLAAHYSNDPAALRAYNSGEDMHKVTSESLKVDRDTAKRINFGIIYGCGANTLAKLTDTDKKTAEKYIRNFFQTYSDIYKFMQDIQTEVIKVGHITFSYLSFQISISVFPKGTGIMFCGNTNFTSSVFSKRAKFLLSIFMPCKRFSRSSFD